MQFSIITLLSLVALVAASPVKLAVRAPQVNAEAPAMTNAAGEVVAFDAATVGTKA